MEIRRLPVPVETFAPGGTTNVYLLVGEESLLVDPAARTDELDELAEEWGIDHVLVTHCHPDHVGAVAHYAENYDATVWARAGREARFEAATGLEPDRSFREGTTIGDATVLETPGHAPDHVALVVDSGIVTGDLAVAEGSVVVGADEGDVRAYLTSLRRLYARNPDRLYPGHGPEIEAPRATVERLIRHRLAREEKILSAVRGGGTTLDELLDAAYEKDLTGVRELARSTVAAHLEKLAVEKKVAWDGSVAQPR